MEILEKRIYEEPSPTDGFRVLVDRLWPRGMKKENAKLDLWAKDIAPTNELRKWYHLNRDLFPMFETRYFSELKSNSQTEDFINNIRDLEIITLLTASKDIDKSELPILKKFIIMQLS